jgi:hypothetical protein
MASMTAAELRKQIEEQTGDLDLDPTTSATSPPGDQEFESDDEEDSTREENDARADAAYELTEEEVSEVLHSDPLYRDAIAKKQAEEEVAAKGFTPEDQAFAQIHQQMFNNALIEDVAALADRYGPEVTGPFMQAVKFGRVKMSEADGDLQNPIEQKFLDWYGNQKDLKAADLKRVIEIASRNKPLRSTSMDVAYPQRLPKGTPEYLPRNPKPRKVTFKDFETMDTEHIQQALTDYLIKQNPKRFRR